MIISSSIGRILSAPLLTAMATWLLLRYETCLKVAFYKKCVFMASFIGSLQGMNPCMTGLSKVFVYEWNDRGLSGFAFVDCDSQVLQLRSFRHYIVCSDVHKSVQVLRFREDVRMIEQIASDYCNARSVLFIIALSFRSHHTLGLPGLWTLQISLSITVRSLLFAVTSTQTSWFLRCCRALILSLFKTYPKCRFN
jgi:hypothetical protein